MKEEIIKEIKMILIKAEYRTLGSNKEKACAFWEKKLS